MLKEYVSKEEVIKLIDKLGYINCCNSHDFEYNNRMDQVRLAVQEMKAEYDPMKMNEQVYKNSEKEMLRSKNDPHLFYKVIQVGKVLNIIKNGGIEQDEPSKEFLSLGDINEPDCGFDTTEEERC